MANAEAIELHYYLSGSAHSMDAFLRNRCEAELLAIFQEVATNLGIDVQIEAQALLEGGLRETWKWIGENAPQLSVIVPVVAILLAHTPDIIESEQDVLNKELTELSIKEKKLQINKLKQEMKDLNPKSEPVVLKKAVELLKQNPKIVVRRSNFYKGLSDNITIESIGIVPLDSNNLPKNPEKKVLRKNFRHFVLSSQALKPIVIDDAEIEVVSPVLREGNYKWKGIYEGRLIGFTMHDKHFKNQVMREEITFQHGTFLECVLTVHRKLDEVGEIEVTGYEVSTVIRKYDDRQSVETSQGHTYKQIKQRKESQLVMFNKSNKKPT